MKHDSDGDSDFFEIFFSSSFEFSHDGDFVLDSGSEGDFGVSSVKEAPNSIPKELVNLLKKLLYNFFTSI